MHGFFGLGLWTSAEAGTAWALCSPLPIECLLNRSDKGRLPRQPQAYSHIHPKPPPPPRPGHIPATAMEATRSLPLGPYGMPHVAPCAGDSTRVAGRGPWRGLKKRATTMGEAATILAPSHTGLLRFLLSPKTQTMSLTMSYTKNARLLSEFAVFALWTYASSLVGAFQGGHRKADLLFGAVPTLCRNTPYVCCRGSACMQHVRQVSRRPLASTHKQLQQVCFEELSCYRTWDAARPPCPWSVTGAGGTQRELSEGVQDRA